MFLFPVVFLRRFCVRCAALSCLGIKPSIQPVKLFCIQDKKNTEEPYVIEKNTNSFKLFFFVFKDQLRCKFNAPSEILVFLQSEGMSCDLNLDF